MMSVSRYTSMHYLKLACSNPEDIQYHNEGLGVELVFWVRFLGLQSLGCWSVHREAVRGIVVESTP